MLQALLEFWPSCFLYQACSAGKSSCEGLLGRSPDGECFLGDDGITLSHHSLSVRFAASGVVQLLLAVQFSGRLPAFFGALTSALCRCLWPHGAQPM